MRKPGTLLIALLAGVAIGLALRFGGNPALLAMADAVKPLGALWVRALQMTLVPLIFAMVASAVVSSAAAGSGGRLIAGALAVFACLLAIAVLIGGGVTTALLDLWPMPPDALAGLPLAVGAPPALPGLADQLLALVPVNPVAAAADGAMMPLVVFAVLFGLAAARVARAGAASVPQLLQEIAAIMLTIVEGVLWFAPAGIFLLALGMAETAGTGMASMLGHYVVVECVVSIAAIVASYALVATGGLAALKRFALGALGPQAMAAGTTSSMATLPAMIEAAITRLDLPERLAGAILPLAASSYRIGSVATTTCGLIIAIAAAGLHPSAAQYLTAGVVIVLANMGAAGVPAAAVLYASDAPGFQVMGAPLALIPLFIAVIAIPDIFTTTANVTADLATTTFIARIAGRRHRTIAGETAGLLPA